MTSCLFLRRLGVSDVLGPSSQSMADITAWAARLHGRTARELRSRSQEGNTPKARHAAAEAMLATGKFSATQAARYLGFKDRAAIYKFRYRRRHAKRLAEQEGA